MDWYKDGIQYSVTCAPLAGFCSPSQIGRYNFTTDRNGMYIYITGLRRSEDQRQWKCTYKAQGSPLEEATMNLTIFTVPSGLLYTLEPSNTSDLSESPVILECVTSGCIYPVPVINWFYKEASKSGLATLYKTTGTQTAETNCTSPEFVSSSRLELLQNTTWSDNSNKTVTFSCGIEFPWPLETVYSKDSFSITFAIRVSWVQMQQNSTTVSNTTLVVTSGDSITFNCVSGTSRPDPTIVWFIENERKGSGANFTFIPADTDHDKRIYCQAYNTNPNMPVESAKPRMFVRVRVTSVTLQENGNGVLNGTLIVTSEQPTTLTCVTGTSRPPAVIEWYFRSQMISNEANLTFTPTYKDHSTDIYCQAYNIDSSKPVISIKQRLFVKVIVSNVTFLDSSSGTMVFYEGYPKTLKCISSPSRPVASITWWIESQSGSVVLTNNINNTEEPDNDGLHKRISEITLTLMKDSRNKKIFCNGSNDGQQPSAVSPQVNVDVWFQPQKPEVKEINATFPWLVPRSGTLHCHSSDYGNPNSSITWNCKGGIQDSLGHLVYQNLVSDDNGKVVFCQLINNYTLMMNTSIISESVTLNVEYSPIITLNMTDVLTVNETQSVSVLCTASGNPSPNQTVWREMSVDNILRFNNISRNVTSNYTCESTAASLKHGRLKSQKTISITVQYAPDVNVTTINQPQENNSSSIRCEVNGVPALYTFHPWKHMWGDVLIRDNLQQNSTGSNDNTLWLERMTMQDTGTYICSADNGIKGINGVVIQNGIVDINVIAIPVIVKEDNNLITEEVGHSVDISIPFYSYPAITNFVFLKNGTEVENTSRTSMRLSTVTVNYTLYSKTVKLEAQEAQLHILNLTLHDFGSYTLLLKNSLGQKSFTVKLDPAGPPMRIKRFYFNRFMEKQIELHFDPGFNGGGVQTFIIEYKSTSGPDNAWKNTTYLNERQIQNRLPNGTYVLTVMQLSPGSYNYRMYSENVFGRSLNSEEILVFIPEVYEPDNHVLGPSVVAITGGVVAAVMVIAIVTAVVIFIRKRTYSRRGTSGLIDNPVYGSSMNLSSPSIKSNDVEREGTVAVKAKHIPTVAKVEDPKHKAKKKGEAKGKLGKVPREDTYENATLGKSGRNSENKYKNAENDIDFPSENVYENPGITEAKDKVTNNDDMHYADLMLGPPIIKAGKFVIHGLDNRLEYAEIAYGIRGEPLPESDDEQEKAKKI
ncbi:hypothetical protein ACJMK2_011798 [Sinanodonta woodiana]|uniref:Ig-like domain-containing protein n=1 Tax=Sinanodonta woodiana TaxID=1069815 RepID=A0ABD3V661_SINWO